MTTVVDASVWVSAAIPDDVHHESSRTWLATRRDGDLVTPTLALVETAGAIARRSGSSALAAQAVSAIAALPNVLVVVPDEELWETALAVAGGRKIRGADALYVALAEALQLPLVTWDREQIERAGRRVTTLTPSD